FDSAPGKTPTPSGVILSDPLPGKECPPTPSGVVAKATAPPSLPVQPVMSTSNVEFVTSDSSRIHFGPAFVYTSTVVAVLVAAVYTSESRVSARLTELSSRMAMSYGL